MFSEHIEGFWKEWYGTVHPSKRPSIVSVIVAIYISLCTISIFVIDKMPLFIGLYLLFVLSLGCIIVGYKVFDDKTKMMRSAANFCWDNEIYTVGKNFTFPFLPTYMQHIIGGRVFLYKDERVTLYDTYYNLDNNYNIGIVVEIELLYPIKEGNVVWSDFHITEPCNIGLRYQCLRCMEMVVNLRFSNELKPFCKREGNKFYLYVSNASMGLVVNKDGMLYKSPRACLEIWTHADSLLKIIDTCLND